MSEKNTAIATIFLDESGNTGANLIDPQQPFFVMAGVNLSHEDSLLLLEKLNSKSPREAHFSILKRRKSGQDGVIRMLNHHLISNENVKICVFHKKYMITQKIVDILIEYMANETGYDLYENGQNIALSNIYYYCIPYFCGESFFNDMQQKFVAMIRKRDELSISEFYESIDVLIENCSSDGFVSGLELIKSTCVLVKEALANIESGSIDPLVPALFTQFSEWGGTYPSGFHVVHDESKALKSQKDLFYDLMRQWGQEPVELGYDRRKFELPLKGKSLEFGESHNYPQLQVADIIASSVNYWAAGMERGEEEDVFFKQLNNINIGGMIVGVIWPSPDVSPESLGTVHDGGINAADGCADFLIKSRSKS